MFFSYRLRDTVEIEPVYFPLCLPAAPPSATSRDAHDEDEAAHTITLAEVILHRLSERYVGRLVPPLGLCVAMNQVVEYSHSPIRGPSAAAWLSAVFEVCVFAPVPGTRLRATIRHLGPEGIFLGLDFFDAYPFLVPADHLVPGSRYEAAKGVWYLPLDGDGEAEAYRNDYLPGEDVVVRVEATVVRDETTSPSLPWMEIRGSFLGDGLGPVSWFDGMDEAEEKEPEME